MAIDWQAELPKILAISLEYGVDPYFGAAIRMAENGSPGREFGVLSEDSTTWDAQCRAMFATVRTHLAAYTGGRTLPPVSENKSLFQILRWGGIHRRACYSRDFIQEFAKTWAPSNVANDPTNLNSHWVTNCYQAYLGWLVRGGQIP